MDEHTCAHAGDIWLRARTNALAHKLAAEGYDKRANIFYTIEALCIVIPILCLILSLQIATAATSPPALKIVTPSWISYGNLTLTAIVLNCLAILINMVGNRLAFDAHAAEHRAKHASYQLIAQKVRRLEAPGRDTVEIQYLCRHLEELFELCKGGGAEPDDTTYVKAQSLVHKLKPFPFDLDKHA